jgi:hypothetical protein
VHFGEAVTLSQREFMALYGHDLKQTVTHLLQGDMERFVMDLRATGKQLVERGVPFREVISCLHLFEESCSVVFDEIPWESEPSERISMLLTFDKLSHCRMMVLVETYFGTTQARAQTRTQALEQEAARPLPSRCAYGLPATSLEILAYLYATEARLQQRYREHMRRHGEDIRIVSTLQTLASDEEWHLAGVEALLLKQEKKFGWTRVAATLDHYWNLARRM